MLIANYYYCKEDSVICYFMTLYISICDKNFYKIQHKMIKLDNLKKMFNFIKKRFILLLLFFIVLYFFMTGAVVMSC